MNTRDDLEFAAKFLGFTLAHDIARNDDYYKRDDVEMSVTHPALTSYFVGLLLQQAADEDHSVMYVSNHGSLYVMVDSRYTYELLESRDVNVILLHALCNIWEDRNGTKEADLPL